MWIGLVGCVAASAVLVLVLVCAFERCVLGPRLQARRKAVFEGMPEYMIADENAEAVFLPKHIVELLP